MNTITLVALALSLPYAAAVVYYVTFGQSERVGTFCFSASLLTTLAAPLLIPGELPLWRLAATLNAVAVATKLVDLQSDRRRAERFQLGGYLLYLPNPFWLCARRGPELPRPTSAQDVRQMLWNLAGAGAGLALFIHVFQWPWQDYPFLLEHAVKVLLGIFTLVRASQVLAALSRLAGLPGHNFCDRLFWSPTPAEFWRRWNKPAQIFLHEYAFKPSGGRRSPRRAALLTFAISGLIHEYVFGLPLGHPTGVQLAFFLVQGGLVVATMGVKPRGAWGVPAIAATAGCMLLSSVLFFTSVNWIVPIYATRGAAEHFPIDSTYNSCSGSARSLVRSRTMSDFLILGTDTDAGKTTVALLWLAAFPREFAYWKPVESGDSDTEKVRQLVPQAACFAPGMRFAQPVAPPLAASVEGRTIPQATELAEMRPPRPEGDRHLLIESFGGPFSPLNECQLQVTLVRQLAVPTLVVSSSKLGAIGRSLKCLFALEQQGIKPFAVVLLGEVDAYAAKQVARYGKGVPVFSLQSPARWDSAGVRAAAERQRETLRRIREALRAAPPALAPAPPILPPRPCAPDSDAAETEVARSAEEDTVLGQSRAPATRDRAEPVTRPEQERWLVSDRRHVWHPYTSLRDPDPPLLVESAHDEFLRLADGREVIDGISSWWTILHGHRHPVLMNALTEAARDFDHVHFAGVTHRHAVRLAELLLGSAPWQGGRVFYSDNGSTAVEVALKMAYQYWCHRGEPQRKLFVGFEHGYHGDTFGAMAASRDPVFFGRFEPLLFRTEIVPLDADRLAETLDRNKGQVAAVIVEPLVQGAGGMRFHTPEDLKTLFDIAHAQGVLFIADEVMTGGGRLGPLWAHQAAGIAPDLICAAKTLTGGVLPLAATLAAPHLVAAFDTDDRSKTFFHGHSFTAHPLACAVAAANWDMLTRSPSHAPAWMEAFWRQALADLRSHPRVRDVRCRGSLAAVEVDAAGGYLADVARQLRQRCLDQGVLLRPLGNVLYSLPPFCTSPASLERIARAIAGAVAAL